MTLRTKLKSCFLIALTFVVSGCQTQQKTRQVYTIETTKAADSYTGSESLLESLGYYEIVAEHGEDSPLAKHMQARVQVDPNKTKGPRSYTTTKKPGEADTPRVMRVASVEKIVVPDHKPSKSKTGFKRTKPGFLNSVLRSSKDEAVKVPAPASAPKPSTKTVRIASNETPVSKSSSWLKPKKARASTKVKTPEAIVTNIRLGDHPGKTRFVLDLTGPSEFEYELNNDKGYLLIDLPGTDWEANTKQVFQSHKLIKGYSVRTDKNGAKVLVVLKKPGRLITSVSLLPNPTRGHRIYFDIGAAS